MPVNFFSTKLTGIQLVLCMMKCYCIALLQFFRISFLAWYCSFVLRPCLDMWMFWIEVRQCWKLPIKPAKCIFFISFLHSIFIYYVSPARSQCEPNPCRNGGTCYDVGGSFECVCQTGYKGLHCEGECCVDQNRNRKFSARFSNFYCSCKSLWWLWK